MNEAYNIDKVLAKKLKNFQQAPPKEVWTKVAAGIGTSGLAVGTAKASLLASIFSNRFFRYGVLAGAGIIIIGLIIGLLNNSKNNNLAVKKEKISIVSKKAKQADDFDSKKEIIISENNIKPNKQKEVIPNSNKTESNIAEKNEYVNADKQQNINEEPIADKSEPISAKVVEKNVVQSEMEENNILAVNNNIPEPKPEINNERIKIKETPNFTNQPKTPINPIVKEDQKEKEITQSQEENPEKIIQKNNSKQDPPKTEEIIENPNPQTSSEPSLPINRIESPWSIGGYFTKDYIFNSADSKSEIKNSYSFDIQTSYKLKNYVFQTGLGFDLSEDNWDYIIKYKRNEALGSYDNVDSVYFSTFIDSLGQVHVVPHFITSTETVYDSISHSLIDQSSNHYYYMHIPMIVGYKIKDFKKWNVMIKGGAMYSVLIHKKEPTIGYYDSDIRVTSVDDKKLLRIKTNMHLLLGFEFEYLISERLSLSFEPIIKYYMKSIYNSNSLTTKQPYSAGLKAGLIYNFK
ncbi:MAG: hypothetical protein K9J13_12205 [Saprospiraceae bacterium]|nr:hypothetical protein [Saprospiraceae bacterium]